VLHHLDLLEAEGLQVQLEEPLVLHTTVCIQLIQVQMPITTEQFVLPGFLLLLARVLVSTTVVRAKDRPNLEQEVATVMHPEAQAYTAVAADRLVRKDLPESQILRQLTSIRQTTRIQTIAIFCQPALAPLEVLADRHVSSFATNFN
jgi:hypothetical protein